MVPMTFLQRPPKQHYHDVLGDNEDHQICSPQVTTLKRLRQVLWTALLFWSEHCQPHDKGGTKAESKPYKKSQNTYREVWSGKWQLHHMTLRLAGGWHMYMFKEMSAKLTTHSM